MNRLSCWYGRDSRFSGSNRQRYRSGWTGYPDSRATSPITRMAPAISVAIQAAMPVRTTIRAAIPAPTAERATEFATAFNRPCSRRRAETDRPMVRLSTARNSVSAQTQTRRAAAGSIDSKRASGHETAGSSIQAAALARAELLAEAAPSSCEQKRAKRPALAGAERAPLRLGSRFRPRRDHFAEA